MLQLPYTNFCLVIHTNSTYASLLATTMQASQRTQSFVPLTNGTTTTCICRKNKIMDVLIYVHACIHLNTKHPTLRVHVRVCMRVHVCVGAFRTCMPMHVVYACGIYMCASECKRLARPRACIQAHDVVVCCSVAIRKKSGMTEGEVTPIK